MEDWVERGLDVDAFSKGGPELDWARWPWQECRAVREPRPGQSYGRCELRRNHKGDHALERGVDIPRWSTDWSDTPGPDWRAVAVQLAEAIRLTREYVGEENLPARPGWSWYDATQRFEAAAAGRSL